MEGDRPRVSDGDGVDDDVVDLGPEPSEVPVEPRRKGAGDILIELHRRAERARALAERQQRAADASVGVMHDIHATAARRHRQAAQTHERVARRVEGYGPTSS
jgi:hypothetical protein